jgi:hypothetical protein
MIQVEFVGLRTLGAPEDRDQLLLKVTYNDISYDWCIYRSAGADINSTIEAAAPIIESQIEQIVTVGGVVQPPVPDYYALRRAEYPSLGDQLDAYWKGPNSVEYAAMQAQIQAVKQKYPKDYINIQMPVTNNPISSLP